MPLKRSLTRRPLQEGYVWVESQGTFTSTGGDCTGETKTTALSALSKRIPDIPLDVHDILSSLRSPHDISRSGRKGVVAEPSLRCHPVRSIIFGVHKFWSGHQVWAIAPDLDTSAHGHACWGWTISVRCRKLLPGTRISSTPSTTSPDGDQTKILEFVNLKFGHGRYRLQSSVGPYSQAETFNLQKSGPGRTPCIPRIYRRTHHVFGTWEVYTEFQLFNLHVHLTCRIFHP